MKINFTLSLYLTQLQTHSILDAATRAKRNLLNGTAWYWIFYFNCGFFFPVCYSKLAQFSKQRYQTVHDKNSRFYSYTQRGNCIHNAHKNSRSGWFHSHFICVFVKILSKKYLNTWLESIQRINRKAMNWINWVNSKRLSDVVLNTYNNRVSAKTGETESMSQIFYNLFH